MAEWPEVEEVEHLLALGDEEWIQDHLQHALDAAIEGVKCDVAGTVTAFDDADPPIEVDERLRQAALRATAVLRVNAPDDGWRSLREDRIYLSLIQGHRRVFGVA
jgi:hypothetical protein